MRQLLDIDLRLIRIFRVIVEAKGLAGAQLVLNLSQSRISTSLAELEARLGARLCRRGRSGFALTEAGRAVYDASHAPEQDLLIVRSREGASRLDHGAEDRAILILVFRVGRLMRDGGLDSAIGRPVGDRPGDIGHADGYEFGAE